mmetsp:Transcript_22278/g.58078  ORF Transcript_22278/g.58078 Transcript_22278/m.58078 type:complete len:931 (+) Transcript_22278:1608-4400(+)
MEKPATQKLKEFWGSLFSSNTPAEGEEEDGKARYTPERLQALYETLHRHPLINDNNKAVVVETVRSIAEFMIWGDQHEPRIFDFFLEHNIMVYLLNILQQPASRTGDVAKQVLQTLSIIIQNVRSETGIFFLFSNNHVNNIVSSNFDFEDEEVLGYYISFLKAISLKLNPLTVRFFLLKDPTPSSLTTTPVAVGEGAPSSMEGLRFPLYTEALKFAHHKEGMVRAGVRTLTLNVYSVPDASIQAFVSTTESVRYFAEVADYMARQFEILSASMSAAEGFGQQALSQLDSQIAEVEDMLSYCNDVFSTAHPYTAHMLARALWQRLAGPYWFKPLLLQTTTADASDTPPIKLQASFYILERVFQLVMYPPLLSNILLSLLAPSPPSHASLPAHVSPQPWVVLSGAGYDGTTSLSCRRALLALLSMRTPLAAPAAVRMLVAITQCRALPPGILASLDLQPQPSPSSEQGLSSLQEIAAKLATERSSSPATGPPIRTPVLSPPAPLLGYGYYTAWSVTMPPSLPLPPTEEELLGGNEGVGEGGQLQGSAAMRHEHELEQEGQVGQQQQQEQQEKQQQQEQLEQAAGEKQEQEQLEREHTLQLEQQQQQQQQMYSQHQAGVSNAYGYGSRAGGYTEAAHATTASAYRTPYPQQMPGSYAPSQQPAPPLTAASGFKAAHSTAPFATEATPPLPPPQPTVGKTSLPKAELILSGMGLQSVPAEVWESAFGLSKLDLSSNQISSLPLDGMAQLTQLRTLLLGRAGLMAWPLPPSPNSLSQLRELVLSGNRGITNLPAGAFVACPGLVSLELSGVPGAGSMPRGTLSGLSNLQRLDLSFTSTTQFPLQELLPIAGTLRVLNLSSNRISSLPADVARLAKLEELCLSNNELGNLPPQLGLLSATLRSLTLDGNPLRSIRRPIIERGTSAVLEYLKERIPS